MSVLIEAMSAIEPAELQYLQVRQTPYPSHPHLTSLLATCVPLFQADPNPNSTV